MVVVSDSSPLHYLILIGAVDRLPQLFGVVVIPERVAAELRHAGAPEAVRGWMEAPPGWLEIRAPLQPRVHARLDEGESHAISLARELRADHLLMDEWAGRMVAAREGLHVVGTLGVLDQAAERGLLSLKEMVERLCRTNFRVDRELIEQLLERDSRRRGRGA